MITGSSVRKIKRYLPIPHGNEITGWLSPQEGWEFVGIPFQWHSDISQPFIEIVDPSGKTTRTVNALDVSEIEFED